MFHRILVALDSPELSQRLMDTLAGLSLTPQSHVILAHVVSVTHSTLDTPADLPCLDPQVDGIRNLEKNLRHYQSLLPCPSELEIASGDPAEEIIRLANIHQADLIVIGSRGLTGLDRILQGSVSSQVVSDAPCSVLVIRQ
jgi:nucleotide-binding universal stress UspA family protein